MTFNLKAIGSRGIGLVGWAKTFQAEASAQILKWEKVCRLGLMKDHQRCKKNCPRNRATQAQAGEVGRDQAPIVHSEDLKGILNVVESHEVKSNYH